VEQVLLELQVMQDPVELVHIFQTHLLAHKHQVMERQDQFLVQDIFQVVEALGLLFMEHQVHLQVEQVVVAMDNHLLLQLLQVVILTQVVVEVVDQVDHQEALLMEQVVVVDQVW